MRLKKSLYLILVLFFSCHIYGSKDSLLKVLQGAKDSVRIKTLLQYANVLLSENDVESAENAILEAKQIASVGTDSILMAKVSMKLGNLNYRKGDFRIAYEQFKSLLEKLERSGDKKLIAECKVNVGMTIGRLGDFKSALEYYHQVLAYYESSADKRPLIRLYSSIAGVYFDQLDYKMSIEFFTKALEVSLNLNDTKTIGQAYNNIGSAKQNMGDFAGAKTYYKQAVIHNRSSGNKHNLAYNLMNIASCELNAKDFKAAESYNTEALNMFREFKDPYSIASCLNLESNILMAQGKKKEALKIMEESGRLSEQIGSPLLLEKTYRGLADVYKAIGDFKNSSLYLNKYISTRDSIINENIREEITKKKLAFQFEKQRMNNSLESAARQKILSDELENNKKRAALQRNISVISISSLLVVAILAFFIYRGAKKNKTASHIIEQQKKVVEVKNKEITDSMHYAKKIQNTLMAQRELITANFSSNFILFKPKDIVSGDFFWAASAGKQKQETSNENLFYLAIGDSTGHGVPGAFMSLLNMGFLNEAIKEKNIKAPNEVLNYIRKRLIESFGTDGQKDGMDGVLLCLGSEKNKITYAAANIPPILVRNGRVGELPYDKMPVGYGERTEPFCQYEVNIAEGDVLYIYTDGYADQFGGPRGKKYMYKNLNQKLQQIYSLAPSNQLEELNLEFNNWKGNLEQVDDVCVIGIKF